MIQNNSIIGVNGFNGRAGKVVPQSGDYTPSMIGAENAILFNSTTNALYYPSGQSAVADFKKALGIGG